ncbi:hypothetical protein EDC56_2301 [Sinobacterium caligoides]|uniref:CDP-glycerol glycerophosphotransferase (TagB/SpsB family) n=1 Tax=Sinobacterium caligoides TaxID=933926 RepID=A0A3N2DQ94_9GAMM|nr:hypothetical protein [Sinobacterium caligoides]ROS01852.1 hypothetical protein EDC56_2301 [Sinobacterium caligoides]
MRLAFELSDHDLMFNHYLPLLFEAIKSDGVQVECYAAGGAAVVKARRYAAKYYVDDCHLLDSVSITVLKNKFIERAKRKLRQLRFVPLGTRALLLFRRFYRQISNERLVSYNDFYWKNRKYFRRFDYILTAELKGGDCLRQFETKIVWMLHGVISSHYPYAKDWSCDVVISPKIGFREELLINTNMDPATQIYTALYVKKFALDRVCGKTDKRKKTVLYNPHWDDSEGLSSWFFMGLEILEYFYNSTQWNLIFAPHIALKDSLGVNVPAKYRACKNIVVDMDSDKLLSGYYIPSADLYLGDVSSQFYEVVLVNPVPAVFISPKKISKEPDQWGFGVVIKDIAELPCALDNARLMVTAEQLFYPLDPDMSGFLSFLESES